MEYMFQGCDTLVSLNLSGFSTGNVKDMTGMFDGCKYLTSIDLSGFNTANVTDMALMFQGCKSLASIDLFGFDTSKNNSLKCMFAQCSSLTSLDLRGFNTARVTDMTQMFIDCEDLERIYVGKGWNTANATRSENMFQNCLKLMGEKGTAYDSTHVDAYYAHIDGGSSNPGYFSTNESPAPTAAYAELSSDQKTLTFYHDNQRFSRLGISYLLNTGENNPSWFGYVESVTQVVFDPSFAAARPASTHSWFCYMDKLTSISGITNLNTSSVTDMALMFNGCKSLTSIDLSGFNTKNVKDMRSMFAGCDSLASLNLRRFNTTNVTNMASMFTDCGSLSSLDLSRFNTSNVRSMKTMYKGCDHLETIYAGNGWSTDAVTESREMFAGCEKLVGGQGTVYDEDHVDAAYAHIDDAPDNPGYFTWKDGALEGDVNGDGEVNISDVNCIINVILGAPDIYEGRADVNGDGEVMITDINAVLAYFL